MFDSCQTLFLIWVEDREIFFTISCFSMSKATIQVEKLTVEEIEYKIDKKEVYYKYEPTTIYFKKVLDMTGTETFTVLSTEN